jgi:para-nitrobenzyl esterase
MGTNRDEMTGFMIGNPELVEAGRMGVPTIKDEALYALLVEYRSEAWRASTVHVLGPLLRRLRESFFAYRFDWDEQPRLFLRDLGKLVGATHGIETAFLFDNFDRSGRGRFAFTDGNAEGRAQLGAALRSYWTEFALHGAPQRGRKGELPPWKPWGKTDKYMLLDTEDGGGLRMHRHAATVNYLLQRLAHDERLPELKDKCRVLYWLTHRGRAVVRERYFDTPGIDCKRFPPDRYPWTAVNSVET